MYFFTKGDVSIVVIVILSTSYTALSTEIKPCKKLEDVLPPAVEISNCDKPPCILKSKTNVSITILFTPKTDVGVVTNGVTGKIAGIAAPFIGVDGTSACTEVYLPGSNTPANCPLKAGEKYVYRNSFKVLEFYPKVNVLVRWSLKDKATRKEILCFEVDAKITN